MATDEAGYAPLQQGDAAFEARMRQMYRYAQLGRCVNGVTHELNNYLGAVMAYTELVALDDQLGDESRRMLGEVLNGVRRASELLTIFTGIARKDKKTESMVDVRNMLEHVTTLHLYATRSGRIDVRVECPESIPAFMGDLPKLELALHYLFMNAMQALDNVAQPAITLKAGFDGTTITVAVKDSAPPVPEPLRERMFEPYVSTFEGPHVGLGLALAREIAELHGGTLTYDPTQGFLMRLPLDGPEA